MIKAYVYKNGAYLEIDKTYQGIVINEAIDETLDNATLITESTIEFEVYDSIKIEKDTFIKYFLVADINIQDLPIYNSTRKKQIITLIEPTKYLEKIIINACSLTNKNDSLRQQINKLLENTEVYQVGETKRFSMAYDLQYKTNTIQSEDFFFEKRTLRECLDEMLSVFNARCEVLEITNFNDIKITFYSLDEVVASVSLANRLKKESVKNIEYLGSNIETSVVNAFTGDRDAIYHPSPKGYATFKTDEAILTSSNAIIKTAFPIEEITEFIVRLNVNVSYLIPSGGGAEDTTNFTLDFDIMRNVVDLETWNLLGTASTSTETAYIKSTNFFKQNTINYTRGSSDLRSAITKIIFGAVSTFRVAAASALLHTTTYVLDTINALHQGEPREINIDDITHITTTNLDYNSAVFRIKYIPYIDAHAKIGKSDYNKVPSTIINAQTDKNVDLKRLGIMLKNNIDRLGNDEIEIDDINTNTSDLLKIGQLINNEYILANKSVSLLDNYNKVRYSLSKNLANINRKIGIDRKRQIYNIPLENFKADTLIKIKVNFSKTNEGTNGFYMLLGTILSTLRTGTTNRPFTNALVRTALDKDLRVTAITSLNSTQIDNYVAAGDLSELYELPLVDYQIANSCLFTFAFDDNFSAGMSSVGQVIGGVRQTPNPYVNSIGEYYQIHIRLFNDFNVELRPTSYNYAKELPLTNESYYLDSFYNPIDFPINACFTKTKDRFEHHTFTTQIEFDSDDPDIIITDKFAEYNALINTDKTTLKAFLSPSKTYTKKDKKALGFEVLSMDDFSFTINANEVSIQLNIIATSIKSWAITDSDDNIIIAYNNNFNSFSGIYMRANYEK